MILLTRIVLSAVIVMMSIPDLAAQWIARETGCECSIVDIDTYGASQIAVAGESSVFKSWDGGLSWSDALRSSPNPIEKVEILSDSAALVVSAGILRQLPPEFNWSMVRDIDLQLDNIVCYGVLSADSGIVLNERLSVLTKDRTASFFVPGQHFLYELPVFTRAINSDNEGVCIVGGYDHTQFGVIGEISVTTNHGGSWRRLSHSTMLTLGREIIGVATQGSANYWALGKSVIRGDSSVLVFFSSDFGNTWHSTLTTFNAQPTVIEMATSKIGYLIDDVGYLYTTLDGGYNWILDTEITDLPIFKGLAVDDNGRVFVGAGSLVYIKDHPTSVDKSSEGAFDVKFYPNPAREAVQIVGREIDRWEVVNLLGAPVLRGYDEVIDTSILESGTYAVRCISGTNSVTKKLVVRK